MGDINPAQNTAALGSGNKNIILMVQEACQPKCTNTSNAGRELRETWMFHHSVTQTYMYINRFPQREGTMHQNALRATDARFNTDLHCTTTAAHSFWVSNGLVRTGKVCGRTIRQTVTEKNERNPP